MVIFNFSRDWPSAYQAGTGTAVPELLFRLTYASLLTFRSLEPGKVQLDEGWNNNGSSQSLKVDRQVQKYSSSVGDLGGFRDC